ncbi:superoxide dismutase [Patescibacteria group bacterium]|nr:superoxide dismutase [Patescibacteria group bacterium]MCL5409326.1 superoxide dismutase [Patescibacteria group bacterium]
MFTLPDLPYDYQALEPFIDEQTMHVHHDGHHAAYVKNLNEALADYPEWLDKEVAEVLKNLVQIPEEIRIKVKNNGGGHFNHSLFWESLSPQAEKEPSGSLLKDIEKIFSSFSDFKKEFTQKAMGLFGSGWTWLAVKNQKLIIQTTANQDSPVAEEIIPILGLDVWEHAYYLKYQNRRAEYIEAWWNVVNWRKISDKYSQNL